MGTPRSERQVREFVLGNLGFTRSFYLYILNLTGSTYSIITAVCIAYSVDLNQLFYGFPSITTYRNIFRSYGHRFHALHRRLVAAIRGSMRANACRVKPAQFPSALPLLPSAYSTSIKHVQSASSMSIFLPVRTFWIKDSLGENVTEWLFFKIFDTDVNGFWELVISYVVGSLLVAILLLDRDLWHLFWRQDRFGGS